MTKARAGLPATSQSVDDYDWIQLTSGEWLKGHIKSLHEFDLDFDSDKLKELTLDWEGVKQLYTPRATCLFGSDHVVVGAVSIDQQAVTISGNDTRPSPVRSFAHFCPAGCANGITGRVIWTSVAHFAPATPIKPR